MTASNKEILTSTQYRKDHSFQNLPRVGEARQKVVNSLLPEAFKQMLDNQPPVWVIGEKKPALGGLQFSDSMTIPF